MSSTEAGQNGEPFNPPIETDNGEPEDKVPQASLKKTSQPEMKTPEPPLDQQSPESDTPSTPGQLPPYDWDDFEARYEKALRDADIQERDILKEAEQLSKYFRAWASAASAHDDERAVKRLRTRQRFVNLSEEKAAQKQQHYEEVVRAFENALALLQAK
ncbi:hypothetical protein HIM_03047 [Hirsutella minnesotensis 3608]|nr:hypothetical protein HIM_03047 [Hirsutella minnesotensis 3608]